MAFSGSQQGSPSTNGEATAAEPPDRVSRGRPILARLDANRPTLTCTCNCHGLSTRNQPDRARNVLEQGLGPTSNDFRLTLELMEMDLDAYRKNRPWPIAKSSRREAGEDDGRHTAEAPQANPQQAGEGNHSP